MSQLSFEWDDIKAQGNLQKHGVTFEEARSVFYDENAIQFWDEDHSESEDRFLLLGLSHNLRLLIIVHCYQEGDSIIRIISARKATKQESKFYRG
jgi:uncharacterized DUF497 family protein